MTTTCDQLPRFAVGGLFVEALAARDFDRLAVTLDAGATMDALVPRGLRQFGSAQEVRDGFVGWFGDATDFELLDAVIGDVGSRLHLRWRVRMRAERLGSGWFLVEQQAYADTDAAGLISRLRLLCSGYCPELSAGSGHADPEPAAKR